MVLKHTNQQNPFIFMCSSVATISVCMVLVLPLLWQALEDTSNQYPRNLFDDRKAMGLKTWMLAASFSCHNQSLFCWALCSLRHMGGFRPIPLKFSS